MRRHLLVRGGIAAQRDVTSNDFFFNLFICCCFFFCCLPEEKEDNHGRVVHVGAETRLCGGPAEDARALLRRQEVRDRAGGAQTAR